MRGPEARAESPAVPACLLGHMWICFPRHIHVHITKWCSLNSDNAAMATVSEQNIPVRRLTHPAENCCFADDYCNSMNSFKSLVPKMWSLSTKGSELALELLKHLHVRYIKEPASKPQFAMSSVYQDFRRHHRHRKAQEGRRRVESSLSQPRKMLGDCWLQVDDDPDGEKLLFLGQSW